MKKLQLSEALEIAQVLPMLDGHQKDGKMTSFNFDNSTLWNLAKNMRILRVENENWQEVRSAKVKELSPTNGDITKESKDVKDVWEAWVKSYLKTEIEVPGLLSLKRSALLANGNPVPASIISVLMPIIEDDAP